MHKFFYSSKMLYILAALLVLVFFLPDLIGPLPAMICGAAVICFAFYIYNLWSKVDDKYEKTEEIGDQEDDFKQIAGQQNYTTGNKEKKLENNMLLEILRKRRSIRKFEDKAVEQEKLDIIIEAMLRSPSSRGLNPWEFVVVTDRVTIKKLARAKPHGASFLADAPLAIVICADPSISDVWIEDTSIASLIVHLCATDLGLGSCWIQIRNRQHDKQTGSESYVIDTLGLKADMAVEAIVAIGYGAEVKPGRASDSLLYDRVSYEEFGKKR